LANVIELEQVKRFLCRTANTCNKLRYDMSCMYVIIIGILVLTSVVTITHQLCRSMF